MIHLILAVISACALCAPAQAAIASNSDDGISIWRVMGALILCAVLAVAGAMAMKFRMSGKLPRPVFVGKNRRLELQETIAVGSQVQLSIVTCDGRELLLATSGQGAQLIRDLGKVRDEQANKI